MKPKLQTWLKCFTKMLLFTTAFVGLHTATINAQQIEVTGQITSSEGDTLSGVTVSVQGTSRGTATNLDGFYSISVEEDGILEVSYVGFITRLVPVEGRQTIDIVMEPDVEALDELIVVGYGTIKRSNVTGSISKVTNERLDEIPLSRVDDALVGQIAGVTIQQTNPAAGEAPSIRVRGQGSISYDSNPLIVVDGISVGFDADYLSSLDMNDVQSIEVLKDASSAAIYGSRGANGIIMVTTKKGTEGPTQFSYNSYVGFKTVPENDYLTTVDAWSNYVRTNNEGQLTDRMQYIQQIGTYTDWADIMYDGGSIVSHSVTAKGGTKNTKFLASLNVLNDEGVLLTDNYRKLNFRVNLNTKLREKLELGVRLNPSRTLQQRFPIGVHDAIRQNPWLPLYLDENNIQYVNRFRENGRWADAEIGDYAMERMFDDYDLANGTPSTTNSGVDISATSNANALAKVLERNEQKVETKVYAKSYLRYDISDNLEFQQAVGADFRYTENTDYEGVESSRNGAADSESRARGATRWRYVLESTLDYGNDFADHSIDGVVGFGYEHWDYENSELIAVGFQNDLIETVPAANLAFGLTAEEEEALLSYFSRINYAFDDKYLLSVSARVDGSSKFGPDKKYGFFPAASAGWNISQEPFFDNIRSISDLKLRISYGVTGNNNGIGEYDYIALLNPVATGFGSIGYNPINIGNPNLGWEKLIEINPGIDVAFLNRKINVSFDYYKRTSEDLLLPQPIPSVTGFGAALVNRGVVENEGVELEVVTRNIINRNFSWTTTALLTHNKNTLVDFAGASGLISIVDDKRPAEWIAMEGRPISSFYGFVVSKEIGLEFIKDPFYPINAQSQDIYVKDLNGDGVIDNDDRTFLGSPYPDIVWSIANNFGYKNFQLSFMFQGSHGAEVRNISSQYIKNEFSSKQDYVDGFADANLVQERIFTSDDIQSASYVALRNLNFSYTLPLSYVNKLGMRSAKLYFSGQNLIYIMADDYEGFNPEGIDQGLDSPLTYGYQRGPAPIYRSFSFGVNLEF